MRDDGRSGRDPVRRAGSRLKGLVVIALGVILTHGIGWTGDGDVCDLTTKACDRPAVTSTSAARTPSGAIDVAEQRVAIRHAPVNGVDHAPITIVAYTDFPCRPCAKALRVLDQMLETYPDDLRVVLKSYPGSTATETLLLHEAALAAGEQGQFRPMAERLQAHPGPLDRAAILTIAKGLRLNTKSLLTALDTQRYRSSVLQNLTEARGFGVTSAPTLFINGRRVVGARSFGELKQIIDEELGLANTASPSDHDQTVVGVDTAGAPVKGPADAAITIVEFSDFQCSFCARAVATVADVLQRYPTQVKWVFKHFPLEIHPDAPLAHEAALAAGAQGKFWEMHDRIFQSQQAIKRGHLVTYAEELGLDVARFTADLDSRTFKARVEQDVAEGHRLGLQGTPTFLINGRRFTGTRSVNEFVQLINEQLEEMGGP